MAKKGQKQNIIEEALILQIVKEKKTSTSFKQNTKVTNSQSSTKKVINNSTSNKNLAKKYGVSTGSIKTWVRKYTYKGYVTRDKRGIKKNPSKMTIEELRIEVDILKKFQAFLKQQQDKRQIL